jgi:hypothetical protein
VPVHRKKVKCQAYNKQHLLIKEVMQEVSIQHRGKTTMLHFAAWISAKGKREEARDTRFLRLKNMEAISRTERMMMNQ